MDLRRILRGRCPRRKAISPGGAAAAKDEDQVFEPRLVIPRRKERLCIMCWMYCMSLGSNIGVHDLEDKKAILDTRLSRDYNQS
jgi:hypothetical protein